MSVTCMHYFSHPSPSSYVTLPVIQWNFPLLPPVPVACHAHYTSQTKMWSFWSCLIHVTILPLLLPPLADEDQFVDSYNYQNYYLNFKKCSLHYWMMQANVQDIANQLYIRCRSYRPRATKGQSHAEDAINVMRISILCNGNGKHVVGSVYLKLRLKQWEFLPCRPVTIINVWLHKIKSSECMQAI